MPAKFDMIKYTGKDGTFGTPIIGAVGFKRVDQTTPSVFQKMENGKAVMIPADDTSDASYYCIYRPDCDAEAAYSYESVIKLVLVNPPDNQLSNIRIYPAEHAPDDPNMAVLHIGCARTYTKPTNNRSLVAIHNIWEFSRDNPFLVTVGDTFGGPVNELASVTSYILTAHDIGYGNLLYLNEVRQASIPIPVGKPVQITDKAYPLAEMTFFDPSTGKEIPADGKLISLFQTETSRVFVINATTNTFMKYPNGIVYGTANSPMTGGSMYWFDTSPGSVQTYEYDVTVEPDPRHMAKPTYYFNDERSPDILFEPDTVHVFHNLAGATHPLRFLNVPERPPEIFEDMVVLDGITVENGGTEHEVVTVDSNQLFKAIRPVRSYASMGSLCDSGRAVPLLSGPRCGYNINNVGGGIGNPKSAGETDFIYMQMRVNGRTTPGRTKPNIIIEYDES